MSTPLVCARGHRWDATLSLPGTAPACPECGDPPVSERETTSHAPAGPQRLPEVPGYEVVGELGRGGMGVVYQARQLTTRRLVALKVLRDGMDDPGLLERFRAESSVLARLRHPNIVGLIEAGQHDGRPYFVMELVTGGALDGLLVERAMAPQEAAQQAEAIARAVHSAHQQGVIHRDLKPANVLVAADGTLKVTDFGLAKRLDVDLRQTSSGVLLGTPAYMSPEQATGQAKEVGPRSDVWAVGVILYEMLTGQVPFQGANALQTLERICWDDPKSPRGARPDVPRDLETICLKCLHKQPARRYPSAADLADDLRRFLEDRPIRARRVGVLERLTKWRRRHPVTAALVAVLAVAVLAGGATWGWYWDRYSRVKVEYFTAVVNRWGVKEGVVRLSLAEVHARQMSYKISKRGGAIERVELVNANSQPATHSESLTHLEQGSSPGEKKEVRFDYLRNEKGELLEETAFDRYGNVLWILHHTTPTTAHYTNADGFPRVPGERSPRPVVAGLPEARTRSGATYLKLEWTAEGWPRQVLFLDRNGRPHPDDDGVYGIEREFDDRGLEVRQTFLDARARPVLHRSDKVAITTGKYDERGNAIEWAFFDPNDRPCLHKDGYHRWLCKYDEHGNPVEWAYFGVNALPCLHKEGNHRWTSRFDGRGREMERSYFGLNDQPCMHKDGYHRATWKYDEQGNVAEWAYFGVNGLLCLHGDGIHRWTGKYDDRGLEVERAYFDAEQQPGLLDDSFHRMRCKYDARGNEIERAYFAVDDKPCLHKEGNHRWTARFDERGNEVERAFFGLDNKPCLVDEDYHRWAGKFDERGNAVEWAYFGMDDRPRLLKEGLHRVTYRFDDLGNEVERACFDVDNKPTLHQEGWHRFTRTYDDLGNEIRRAFFGVNGLPCLANQTFHRWTARHDERGNEGERAFFGVDDKPCLIKSGVHRWTARYDERGHRVEEASFGMDDRPCLTKEGWYRYTKMFDERDDEVEVACFGVDGKPCLHLEGWHRKTRKFDERDRAIDLTFFGVDDKPCLNNNGVHRRSTKRDARGNEVEMAFFGVDGKPCLNNNGVHRRTTTRDARGKEIEKSFFAVDGGRLIFRVTVSGVSRESQAERLGLRPGDVLLQYGGTSLTQGNAFVQSRQREKSTDPPRPLVVERDGKRLTVQVSPGPLGLQLRTALAPSPQAVHSPAPRE